MKPHRMLHFWIFFTLTLMEAWGLETLFDNQYFVSSSGIFQVFSKLHPNPGLSLPTTIITILCSGYNLSPSKLACTCAPSSKIIQEVGQNVFDSSGNGKIKNLHGFSDISDLLV